MSELGVGRKRCRVFTNPWCRQILSLLNFSGMDGDGYTVAITITLVHEHGHSQSTSYGVPWYYK